MSSSCYHNRTWNLKCSIFSAIGTHDHYDWEMHSGNTQAVHMWCQRTHMLCHVWYTSVRSLALQRRVDGCCDCVTFWFFCAQLPWHRTCFPCIPHSTSLLCALPHHTHHILIESLDRLQWGGTEANNSWARIHMKSHPSLFDRWDSRFVHSWSALQGTHCRRYAHNPAAGDIEWTH